MEAATLRAILDSDAMAEHTRMVEDVRATAAKCARCARMHSALRRRLGCGMCPVAMSGCEGVVWQERKALALRQGHDAMAAQAQLTAQLQGVRRCIWGGAAGLGGPHRPRTAPGFVESADVPLRATRRQRS